MGYKELNATLARMITEIKNVTQDIELVLMIVDKQHHDRLRTRSSDKD